MNSSATPSFPWRTTFRSLAFDPKYSMKAALGPILTDIALNALSAAIMSDFANPGLESEQPARSVTADARTAAKRMFMAGKA